MKRALFDGAYVLRHAADSAALVYQLLDAADGVELSRTLEPHLDEMRFYPQLVEGWSRPPSGTVFRRDVGWLRERVRSYRAPEELRRMSESLGAWLPLQETLLDLIAQTRVDGWPYQSFSPDWGERGQSVVNRLYELLSDEVACHFPQRTTSSLRELADQVEQAVADPAGLSGRQVGFARRILADSEERWGPIGSPERARALAARESDLPVLEEARVKLSDRLTRLPAHGGVENLETLLAPLPSGRKIPRRLAEEVLRCQIGSPRKLVDQHVLNDARDLGAIVRDWVAGLLRRSAHSQMTLPQNRMLGDLYSSHTGEAFEELPWVRPIFSPPSPVAAGELAREMLALCWERFPEQWEPEELVREVWTLLAWSGFAPPGHVELVNLTRRSAQGLLYDRYYSISGIEILDKEALLEFCRERAASRGKPEEMPEARLREELRIMDAGGLWIFWNRLRPEIDPGRAATRIVRSLLALWERPRLRKNQRWQRHRELARLWQRLMFFLSLLPTEGLESELKRLRTLCPEGGECRRMLERLPNPPSSTDTLVGWCLD